MNDLTFVQTLYVANFLEINLVAYIWIISLKKGINDISILDMKRIIFAYYAGIAIQVKTSYHGLLN